MPLLSSRLSIRALVASLALTRGAQALELLPEASGRLEIARYSPVETDLHWSGWIGAGLTLARSGATALSFDADIETIAGNSFRAFDASQVNYHLAGTLSRGFGRYDAALVLHHVSRHRADREKEFSFDWNMFGVQLGRSFQGPVPVRVTLGAGRAVQASRPLYRWELSARAELDVWRAPWGGVYGDLGIDALGAESRPEYPRDGFADAHVEGGLRLRRAARRVEVFVSWERRNDVLLERPGARSRALFGLRLWSGERGWR